MKVSMDDLLRRLGNPGRLQVFVYILLCLNYFPIVTNHLAMAIYGSKIPFHCDVSKPVKSASNGGRDADVVVGDILDVHYGDLAASENSSVNYSIPKDEEQKGRTLIGACDVYERDSFNRTTNETVSCSTGWVYDTPEVSIVTDWDLVCEDSYLVKLSTTVYFCGVMAGGIICGYLSDQFGRKILVLAALYLHIVIGVGISFSPNYIFFTIFRFIQGALMQGIQTTSYTMVMELFTPEHRSLVGAVIEVFWGMSYITLAGLWYLLQNWRHIQLAITLPCILTITYIWLLPESLRWLLLKNKFKKADEVIAKMVKYNKIEYPVDLVNTVKTQLQSQKDERMRKYTVLDLIKTPAIRKRSLILFYTWFATAVGYYGLSLSATSLPGNKFFNFFISGLVELPAYVAAIFILKRFGRRRPMFTYFMLAGVACIAAGVIPVEKEGFHKLSLALALFGKFSMAGLFSVVFLYAAELFPTVMRNVGCGACAFFLRFGGVMAPQMLLLGEYTFKQLPVVLFGSLALVGGFLTLLLPETLNRKLPDTVEDAENIHGQGLQDSKGYLANENTDEHLPLGADTDTKL